MFHINQLTASKFKLERLCCLYMPVDNGEEVVYPWYKEFNSRRGAGARLHNVYMDQVAEKEGLTNTFLTDEWIP